MKNLVEGIHRFRAQVVAPRKERFRRMADGQNPSALFITCSDSRINPNLITQTEPGELFILRNAGNIVPNYGSVFSGEAATIEFAVAMLGVQDIVVCGHTHCGAVEALLNPAKAADTPALRRWLEHAESTRRILAENYKGLTKTQLAQVAVQEHVLTQLESLQTHPVVAARLAARKLSIHAWVYEIETGEVLAYDDADGCFQPVSGETAQPKSRKRGRRPIRLEGI